MTYGIGRLEAKFEPVAGGQLRSLVPRSLRATALRYGKENRMNHPLRWRHRDTEKERRNAPCLRASNDQREWVVKRTQHDVKKALNQSSHVGSLGNEPREEKVLADSVSPGILETISSRRYQFRSLVPRSLHDRPLRSTKL
jgi:hypothetical protein